MKFGCINSCLFLLIVGAVSLSYGQQDSNDLGKIVGEFGSDAMPLRIEAEPRINTLLTGAFLSHGAFNIKAAKTAEMVLRFKVVSETKVLVEGFSGNRKQFSGGATGRNLRDSALRAADYSVMKMTKVPGYFAGRIAFVGGVPGRSEIYISDLFCYNPQVITRDGSHSLNPSWSPRGDTILYTGYFRSGFPDIFKIDTRSGKRTVFASFRGTNMGATYNSAGNSVAMALSGTGNSEIYVSNSQGRSLRRLTRTRGLESAPTWSPDGRSLAFCSTETGGAQLFQMKASGGKMRRIPTNISGNCTEPDWNPVGGDSLAFTALMGREFEIIIYDFKSKKSRIVTKGAGDAIEANWLSDGRHLIYTQRTRTSRKLYILDTESGRATPIRHEKVGQAWQADFVYPH